jgi:hypothetical protein
VEQQNYIATRSAFTPSANDRCSYVPRVCCSCSRKKPPLAWQFGRQINVEGMRRAAFSMAAASAHASQVAPAAGTGMQSGRRAVSPPATGTASIPVYSRWRSIDQPSAIRTRPDMDRSAISQHRSFNSPSRTAEQQHQSVSRHHPSLRLLQLLSPPFYGPLFPPGPTVRFDETASDPRR